MVGRSMPPAVALPRTELSCGKWYALEVEQPTPNMGCLQSVGPTGFVPYGGRGLSNRSTTTKTSSQLHLLYDGSVEETEGMANKKTCVYH